MILTTRTVISLMCVLTLTFFTISSDGLIEDVVDILRLGKEITSSILETWDIVDQTNLADEIDIPFLKKKQKKIISRMTELSRQIELVEDQTKNTASWTIDSINKQLVISTKLELGLHELSDLMNRISSQSTFMKMFGEHFEDLEPETLQKFAEWTVSPNPTSIQGILDRIHLLMTGSEDLKSVGSGGVLNVIALNLEEAKNQVCATRQSAQQVLFQLYNAISVTELKGYAMMQFSWMLLKTYGKGNFTRESKLMQQRFENRTAKTQELLRGVMQRADRTVWRCDPIQHIEGETYEQITRLLQGYIENEVDMNNDGTCRENCAHYKYTENFGCYKDLYCSKQPRCAGKLLNCEYIDSDMWVCPSKLTSTRRYEFIEYENGKVLGKKNDCSRGSTKVDSWWRWLFWHCSYCMCICDQQGPQSDRFFNLREYTSNTSSNRVVTGLRFIKANRILHLQIQEGQLTERGGIDALTVEWKPISNYKILDREVRNGIDYHTLSWDKRAIDLDDVIRKDSPTDVVTGIRFRVVGTHLNLEVRFTEANFVTGRLIDPDSTSVWISNDNTDASEDRRTKIILKRPNIPTSSPSRSIIDSGTNQFIEFDHSDRYSDAAQTTVPFIDKQEVVSIPPVALSGAGIYHKGRELYGGFVAPKLITYDFGPHIVIPQPNE